MYQTPLPTTVEGGLLCAYLLTTASLPSVMTTTLYTLKLTTISNINSAEWENKQAAQPLAIYGPTDKHVYQDTRSSSNTL